jgi:hypothetical protein
VVLLNILKNKLAAQVATTVCLGQDLITQIIKKETTTEQFVFITMRKSAACVDLI